MRQCTGCCNLFNYTFQGEVKACQSTALRQSRQINTNQGSQGSQGACSVPIPWPHSWAKAARSAFFVAFGANAMPYDGLLCPWLAAGLSQDCHRPPSSRAWLAKGAPK